MTYFDYCRSLSFEQTPDYAYLRGLFSEVMKKKVLATWECDA